MKGARELCCRCIKTANMTQFTSSDVMLLVLTDSFTTPKNFSNMLYPALFKAFYEANFPRHKMSCLKYNCNHGWHNVDE